MSESTSPWRLCVAPMMDWTDRHCRAFHRQLSVNARLYTEMVHAQAVIHGDRERLLGFDAAEHPVALQLGGSDPAVLAAATRIGGEWGYDEVNLNVGCPSDRVQSGNFGACLMREPSLVAECFAAMQAATDVRVTIKCRLGVDEQDEYEALEALVTAVARAGCRTFVVHARKAWLQGLSPKENRDVPPLNYARVHRLKAEHPELSIVLNGGLSTAALAVASMQSLDGVMIGRAAYHEPYVLAELERDLFGATGMPTRESVVLAMQPYVEAQLARGEILHHVTRHWLGLFHGQPGARQFRRVLTEQGASRTADWRVVERALDAVRSPSKAAA